MDYSKSTFDYLNFEVKPYFTNIIKKAIIEQPKNWYFFLLSELMSCIGEDINSNPDKKELIRLRKLKEKMKDFIKKHSYDNEFTLVSDIKNTKNDDINNINITKDEFNDYIKNRNSLIVDKKSICLENTNINKNINDHTTELKEDGDSSYNIEDSEIKDYSKYKSIIDKIKNSFTLHNIPLENKDELINSFKVRNFIPDEIICKQGDIGNELFIVEEGELECFVEKQVIINEQYKEFNVDIEDFKEINLGEISTDDFLRRFSQVNYISNLKNEMIKIKEFKKGDLFGELALIYNSLRLTTIISKTNGKLLTLNRDSYQNLINNSYIQKRNYYKQFIEKVELLHELSTVQKNILCEAIIERQYNKDDIIIKENSIGDLFYMVDQGELIATKKINNKEIEEEVMRYNKGDYFGELALIKDDLRKATIKALVPCKLLTIERAAFKRLVGPLKSVVKEMNNKYDNLDNID